MTWRQLDGPPAQKIKMPVWQNERGDRIHAGGMLKTAEGQKFYTRTSEQWDDFHEAKKQQPKNHRAVMVWAEKILTEAKQ